MSDNEIGLDRLAEIISHAGEGIIYQEAGGRIKLLNQAAQRLLSPGSLQGPDPASTTPDWHLVFDDGSPCPDHEHPSMITLRTGQALRDQIRGLARPGQPVTWLSINTIPITPPGQESPAAVVSYISDITERKGVEDALHQSEERFQKVFQRNPLSMCITTPDGRFLDVNEAYQKNTGYSREELLGKSASELGLWDDPSQRDRLVHALREGHGSARLEVPMRLKSGERRHIMLLSSPAELAGQNCLVWASIDVTPRALAEEALSKSEDQLRFITANISDTIWRADADLKFTYISSSIAKLSGYASEDMLGREVFGFLSDESKIQANKTLMDLLAANDQTQSPRAIEFELVRKDGTTLCIESHITLLYDDKGGFQGMLGVNRDITERKKAEKALKKSEKELRSLVKAIPDVVMRFDRQGRHLFVSESVRDMADLKANQFIGKSHRELGFPPAQCRFWEQNIERVFTIGASCESELVSERPSGQKTFNCQLVPELDDRGKVASVLAVARDITAHRKAEQDYQTLFREMLDGFALHKIICDDEGRPQDYRFLAVNPAFERMTGLKAENLIGKTVLEIMPGTERHWIENYGKVALTGEPILFENYSGELQKHFEVAAFRPAPGQFACIFTDISQRKRAEEERALAENQLRQAQKMEALGTLAGGIAHDFNNLLSAIMGYAEMAREDAELGAVNPDDISQILTAADRAKSLVKQILTFSRRVEPERKPLDLNQEVERAMELLGHTLPKMISTKLTLPSDLRRVYADPNQISQVILNLATNAYQAMPDGGQLSIYTNNVNAIDKVCPTCGKACSGDWVALTISDNGQGIHPEDLSRIFDPFFTTKELGKGTGLGLSMVQGIVMSHGGHVECRSQLNHGTAFTVFLPVAREISEINMGDSLADHNSLPGGSETVLLVDDEKSLRELGARILKNKGYETTTAGSGEEALEVYGRMGDSVDLIIMDLGMPGMGGHKAMKAILAINPAAKVIVASGYAATGRAKGALEDGATGYVGKPFKKADLLTTVRRVLDDKPR